MAVYFGEIDTFPKAKADRKQVNKILEEAAEVFSALEDYEQAGSVIYCEEWKHLLDECADVQQAVANLVAALGVGNFTFFVEACERRNRERGRYDA